MTERSTPKSFSMRENSGAYSFAFSLPAMMRQSDHAPIEILPELLVELGLSADRLKAGGVGAQPAHDAVVCVSADAAAKRLGAERSDPLGKIAGSARPRRAGRECRSGGKRQPESLATARFSDAGAAIGDLGFLHGA
jgi:hypothetical protein